MELSWSTRGLAYQGYSSLGYSRSLVVTTRTSITILSPCNILQTSDTTNISTTRLQVPQYQHHYHDTRHRATSEQMLLRIYLGS
eukprot:scaffold19959_cov78-Attheya_sp.AAC.1